MRISFAVAMMMAALFVGCSNSTEDSSTYSKQGGGSMEGAGGAGPGYDGTGSGRGPHGTAPDSGAAREGKVGHTQTNSAMPNPPDADAGKEAK